jgi:Xaa-Pro aminopeptidase
MSTPALALPSAAARHSALQARRACLEAAWQGVAPEGGDVLVVVPGGLVLDVEGSDQHYGFRVHDDHAWLSGCRLPAQVLAYDAAAGWTLFVYRPSQQDRVWHGAPPDLDVQAEDSGLSSLRPLEELGAWLEARAGRAMALLGNPDLLERPAGYGVHPELLALPAWDGAFSQRAQACVVAGRRAKDAHELACLRAAAEATAVGHLLALRDARIGWSERLLQIEIDAAFQRAGAERPAYGTIAASGPNAAVLHATPGARCLAAGDLVLVDAGAEVLGYDADVTRTWPVAPRFTSEQRDLYEIVLELQQAAIEQVRPGVEYRDIHMQAARAIARGLVDFGVLRGDPDGLVEQDAHALFFPHGIGHLIGLATHDVGGYLEGRTPSDRPGLRFLRSDLPLQEGYVVTIEPGIYFIPALLTDKALRETYRDAVDWTRADALLSFGGIRIEDDVVASAEGPEVLTGAIPKDVAALEALRG